MPCELSTNLNYAEKCREHSGGIKAVWFLNKDNATLTIAASVVTAIVNGTGEAWTKYTLLPEGSDATSSFQGGRVGNKSHTHGVHLMFAYLDSELIEELKALKAGYWWAIVQDVNDRYWLLGREFGLFVADSDGWNSGRALGDAHRVELDLTSLEVGDVLSVDESLIAGLETPGV